MKNYVTHNGGSIRIDKTPIPVEARLPFPDGTGIDTACPFCLSAKPREIADFIQYGMLTDAHDTVYWCDTCDRPFVLEYEVPA